MYHGPLIGGFNVPIKGLTQHCAKWVGYLTARLYDRVNYCIFWRATHCLQVRYILRQLCLSVCLCIRLQSSVTLVWQVLSTWLRRSSWSGNLCQCYITFYIIWGLVSPKMRMVLPRNFTENFRLVTFRFYSSSSHHRSCQSIATVQSVDDTELQTSRSQPLTVVIAENKTLHVISRVELIWENFQMMRSVGPFLYKSWWLFSCDCLVKSQCIGCVAVTFITVRENRCMKYM